MSRQLRAVREDWFNAIGQPEAWTYAVTALAEAAKAGSVAEEPGAYGTTLLVIEKGKKFIDYLERSTPAQLIIVMEDMIDTDAKRFAENLKAVAKNWRKAIDKDTGELYIKGDI